MSLIFVYNDVYLSQTGGHTVPLLFNLPPNHCILCDSEDPLPLTETIGCRCARIVSAGKLGPTGPQHSLKCQIVLLTREKLSVWKRGNEGKTGREGCKITRKSDLMERDFGESAEVLMRESREGAQTYGQSTRHESEVSFWYGQGVRCHPHGHVNTHRVQISGVWQAAAPIWSIY